ncbi:hypothetical protein LCGC14_1120870 [marine sediment metagenome]|uniref:Uncharacterized protein n=1 Tax=marine sediment metagenome TaxID=412755 RepID=A0A0F9M8V0_9ZZZZ
MVSNHLLIGSIVTVLVAIGFLVSMQEREPTLVTRIDQKQVATAGSYAWPEGAIIHKQYGNSWYCVEIDGHHLVVRSRGNDSVAASVSSCEED